MRHPVPVIQGNTPACAGKTLKSRHDQPAIWEHPRVRGEDIAKAAEFDQAMGTPPRARGRPRRPSPTSSGQREHPRVRGEDPPPAGLRAHLLGTPPRARGRQNGEHVETRLTGNTPACAGKTTRCWGRPTPSWEHPRVRGEDVWYPPAWSIRMGTPPRARGRRSAIGATHEWIGNTPACAGKTRLRRRRSDQQREHPRVRGEDHSAVRSNAATVGTPPRARGRPPLSSMTGLVGGNTPACAGKTPRSAQEGHSWREHPRVRGEDCTSSGSGSDPRGTPPRARGRQIQRLHVRVVHGNTPACAGKTSGHRRHP